MINRNRLIEEINKVVKNNTSIYKVKESIKTEPLISTLDEIGWNSIKTINFESDKSDVEVLPDFSEITHLMYWKIKDEKWYTEVVGIWWDNVKIPHLFCGKIYAP